MVDVVVNHFAWYGLPTSVNYSSFTPFNSQSYFHPFCEITQQDYASDITAVEQVNSISFFFDSRVTS